MRYAFVLIHCSRNCRSWLICTTGRRCMPRPLSSCDSKSHISNRYRYIWSCSRSLSEKETDMRDKLTPIVLYLQKLGPEYVDQTFETSRWVYEQDSDIAFEVWSLNFSSADASVDCCTTNQIFTSEDVELPRHLVINHLETIDSDPRICCRFIEFLINERHEESAEFHDRLVELYLKMISTAGRRGDDGPSVLLTLNLWIHSCL
jgi:hypothetical protein